jgi:hypothetical protein
MVFMCVLSRRWSDAQIRFACDGCALAVDGTHVGRDAGVLRPALHVGVGDDGRPTEVGYARRQATPELFRL